MLKHIPLTIKDFLLNAQFVCNRNIPNRAEWRGRMEGNFIQCFMS